MQLQAGAQTEDFFTVQEVCQSTLCLSNGQWMDKPKVWR